MEIMLGAEPADGNNLIKVTIRSVRCWFHKSLADYRWGIDKTVAPTFSLDELTLMVQNSQKQWTECCCPCIFSWRACARPVWAGIETIEHGDGGTLEVFKLMKERSVVFIPTLGLMKLLNRIAAGWKAKHKNHYASPIRNKVSNDALIGCDNRHGGDVGVFAHGENVLEMELMVEYGMKPIDVLRSANKRKRESISRQSRGSIKPGLLADFVLVSGDPSQTISASSEKMLWVMKDGAVYRDEKISQINTKSAFFDSSVISVCTPNNPVCLKCGIKKADFTVLSVRVSATDGNHCAYNFLSLSR